MKLPALRSFWRPKGLAAWVRLLWSGAVAVWLASLLAYFVEPLFARRDTLGNGDWDQMESYRYFVVKAIRDYHQFPFWNPYACGGHPAWGGPESGSTVVNPWGLVYFLFPLPMALRLEVTGCMVLGAVGAWLFARRFTKSAAATAIVCILFTFNSRCVMQLNAGHIWHLYYCWMPWALWFYDRATAPRATAPWRDATLAGVVMALMFYTAAIYALPQTGLLLGIMALAQAIARRSWRPLGVLAIVGGVAFGLAAPKLLPVVDTLSRFPRLVESSEVVQIGQLLVILTSPAGIYMGQWGWHEYGMYVGWAGFFVLLVGAAWGRGERYGPYLWAAAAALLLGLGTFHEYSPWHLVHMLPIFKSQHVPSRWEYPALLLFGALFAVAMERLLSWSRPVRPLVELLLLFAAVHVESDILQVTQPMMQGAFVIPWTNPPDVTKNAYYQEKSAPASLRYAFSGYSEPSLPAEFANVGVIDCLTSPGLNMFERDAQGHARGLGAKGRAEAEYRGEAYTANGKGTAVLTHFTPNEFVVETDGVTPGDLVVLNQNWDPGWEADGRRVLNFHDVNAIPSRAPNERIVFRYRPRWWWLSLAVFAATVGLIAVAATRLRSRRRT